jgi:hypothetical protein
VDSQAHATEAGNDRQAAKKLEKAVNKLALEATLSASGSSRPKRPALPRDQVAPLVDAPFPSRRRHVYTQCWD